MMWENNATTQAAVTEADKVLIMLGTNDAGAFGVAYSKEWAGIYLREYKALLDTVYEVNPDAQVYVLTSPFAPNAYRYTNLSQWIVPLQLQIAAEYGLPIIDIYHITRDVVREEGESALLGDDRLHPDEEGLGIIAKACYDALTAPVVTVTELTYSDTAATDYTATGYGNVIAAGALKDADRVTMATMNMLAADGVAVSGCDGTALAAITDGKVPGVNAADGAGAPGAGITVDFGEEGAIVSQILVAGDKTALPASIEVYITDDTANPGEAVWAATNLTDTATVARLITLAKPVTGRYMVVKAGNAVITELAAVGAGVETITVPDTPEEPENPVGPRPEVTVESTETEISKGVNEDKLIAAEDNLLNNGNSITHPGDPDTVYDGLVAGIHDGAARWREWTNTWFDGWLTFDLGTKHSVSSLLVAGSANPASDCVGIYGMDVYVGTKTAAEIKQDISIAPVYSTGDTIVNARRIDFTEAQKGRYLVIRLGGNSDGSFNLSELVACGENLVFSEPLIQGLEPESLYLAYPGRPGRYLDGQNPVFDNVSRLTDGVKDGTLEEVRCGLTNINGTTFVTDEEWRALAAIDNDFTSTRSLIAPSTPWIVAVYYLGGTCEVSTMTLTSTPEPGYYVAGADFYVSDTIADLFDVKNRVYTTGGEKTTTKETAIGEIPWLDAAYDKNQRELTADLSDVPATGRYAAFVITRAYGVGVYGYGTARLTELEVSGRLVNADPPFDKALLSPTDETTGISVTLPQINSDDKEFFENLDLRVTVSDIPTGVQTDIEGGWMTADSAIYTLELVDKQGNVIPDDVVGEREWYVSFPTKADYFQMLGVYKEGRITRLRHSYTNKDNTAVVGGSSTGNAATIYGNGHAFVVLKFKDMNELSQIMGRLPDGVSAEE